MAGARQVEVPASLASTCFVCPTSTHLDDVIDCKALWHTLVDITGRARFSSSITGKGMAREFSLRKFVVGSEPRDDGESEENRNTKSRRTDAAEKSQREFDSASMPARVTAIRHAEMVLTETEGRGREWVCNCKEGLAAGVSVLDAETQREREWWEQGGADTCALFCEWMEMYLKAETTNGAEDEHAVEKDRAQLVNITAQLHPASSATGSSSEEWEELRQNIPEDVRTLFDSVAQSNGRCEGQAKASTTADLPAVWRKLQMNQMGSYTHPEHVGGAYERLWRFFTGTGCYPLASIGFNHSCTPNLLRVGVGPLLFFRTARPVAYLEPLTISYLGTDVLREPLHIRIGEQGGGLSDRDFTCACSLCDAERGSPSGEGASEEVVVALPATVKGELRMADVRSRIEMMEALLRGEGISVEAEEEDGGSSKGGVKARLMKKDTLELEVELGLSLLEDGRYQQAVEVLSELRSSTMPACLPADTLDELASSVDLYLLAVLTASELQSLRGARASAAARDGDGLERVGSKRARFVAGTALKIDAGADPAVHSHAISMVETLQSVFGTRAARAMVLEPSVLRTELCYVCTRMAADGEEVMAAAWRYLLDAGSVVWGNLFWQGEGSVWYEMPRAGMLQGGGVPPTKADGAASDGASDLRLLSIAREHGSELPPERFWREYMVPNVPVLLDSAGVGAWRISKEWVQGDGTIDPAAIKGACGGCKVTVHDCSNRIAGYDTVPTSEMTVGEYLDWWRARSEDSQLLYLKDWNLTKDERFSDLYEWPAWFREDWLNQYEQETTYDHRFVYLGPKGSFTPLHRDTLHSFSWSANVSGRKRWWMFPPLCTEALTDSSGKPIPDIRTADAASFPRFELEAKARMVVVDQQAGEIMFVPSGWWHQVENLTDCLSVNHNWINQANVQHSWALLEEQRKRVALDVPLEKDESVLQDLLQFRIGWHYQSFHAFLCKILDSEMRQSRTALEKHKAGADNGDLLWLKRLGLTRLRDILLQLRRSEASQTAATQWPSPQLPELELSIVAVSAALQAPPEACS